MLDGCIVCTLCLGPLNRGGYMVHVGFNYPPPHSGGVRFYRCPGTQPFPDPQDAPPNPPGGFYCIFVSLDHLPWVDLGPNTE